MKKYLIAFIFLLPILAFGQNVTKNFVKTTKYNHSAPPNGGGTNLYDNYNLHMDLSTSYAQDFLTDYATGYVDVTILNDILTVEFKGTFNAPARYQTESQTTAIASNIPLPNVVLGDLDAAGHADVVKVSILNNMLYLEENYSYAPFNSFNETFIISLNPNIIPSEKIESVTYFDGIGRPIQKIGVGQAPKLSVKNNLFDWESTWTLGNGMPTFFNLNGTTAENKRINGMNPFGLTSVIWECGSDTGSNEDGGWNTNSIAIDKNVKYQYAVWIKRTGNMDGYGHHGTLNVRNLAGVVDSNPYFWVGDTPELDKWYLVVGVVHPASYTGGDTGVSGLYDVNGNKVMDGDEFKWDSTTTSTIFRSYFYYATDLNAKQYFYSPTLQKFDGTQYSIAQFTSNPYPSDLVKHIAYDSFGRESKDYLTYASNNTLKGYDYANPVTDLNNFYNTSKYDFTQNPYTEKRYDASPLDEVLEEGAPGNAWKVIANSDADRTIKRDNLFNSATDKVKNYSVNISPTDVYTLQDGGYYSVNELFKVVTKNENWTPTQPNLTDNTTIEFNDKLGSTILKRSVSGGKWHDTYNVYDAYGNLAYILPPMINTYPSEQQIWNDQYVYMTDINTITENGIDVGGNEAEVSLNSNELYVYLSTYGETTPSPLNISTTVPAITLNFDPKLPDMDLGFFTTTGGLNGTNPSNVHYRAYIQDGNIYFSGDGTPVYDAYINFGVNLSTVATATVPAVDATMINELGYQYKYDSRNRLIEKKLPGKDWDYTVYDNLDRPILTQDGNLRTQNKWVFIKYGAFDRLIYSGIWTNTVANQSRQDVQGLVDAQVSPVWSEAKSVSAQTIGSPSTTVYYTNNAFPKLNLEVLSITYYDNYTFVSNPSLDSDVSFGIIPVTNAKSLETGTKIKILGTSLWKTNVNYYDDRGRLIYNASNNEYLGTASKVKRKLDFANKLLETESSYIKGAFTVVIKDKFTYDATGRILTQKQQIDNQAEQLIVKNEYNEVGNLITTNVGGKTNVSGEKGLQKVDFSHNVRGWLKDINNISHMENDLFALKLNYDEQNQPYTNGPGQPLFNRNISGMTWKTDNISSTLKSYYYDYDNLDRMKSANYAENGILNYKYNESISKYDRNGNILDLFRNTQSTTNTNYGETIDYLAYQYKGNQLLSVTDAYGLSVNGAKGFKDRNTVGDDYTYDANGNMTKDKNKDITAIEYNHLNLPIKIVFNNADENSPNPKVIFFKYNADGIKIEKTVKEPKSISGVLTNTTTTTQYDGSAVYLNGDLQFFSQSEGYVAYNASAAVDNKYSYVFQYKDQVGNIRLSYADANNDGVITGATTEVFYDGFETASGWESQGFSWGQSVSSYDNVKKHSGNVSGKIEKLTAGERVAHSNNWVAINNSQSTDYIFSAWIYSDNPSVDIFLFKSNAAETGYPANFDYINTSQKNRWVYVEKRVTVPANFTKLNLRIDNNGGGTVWFDDLSIRKVNAANDIEIVDENNFYPFGLKHEGYNNAIAGGNAIAQQFKYQGQERQEELGLMWDSFKWRNYDPAIGRFMSIDPLAEKYTYNSTYAFQENKIGIGRELEGLEVRSGTGMDQFQALSRQFSYAMANIVDFFGFEGKTYVSGSYDLGGNNSIQGELSYTASPTATAYLSEITRDPTSPQTLFDIQFEAFLGLVKEYCIAGKFECVDFEMKVADKLNFFTFSSTTEVSTSVGAGGATVVTVTTLNHQTGQTTTRAGVQLEAKTPIKVAGFEFNAGVSATVGQKENRETKDQPTQKEKEAAEKSARDLQDRYNETFGNREAPETPGYD
ncbi:DUF6443 domain-containing protein [Flavobacterium amniphilum]|uniref:DUF6443 domain-containing protein n=1 Tax=Flavobacterium amniphilum TaxID=1834035 RepID=UPI002029F01D|nr:DUF6443 domain-containing protein [Flavobacterium amniphilum]MCL9804653.1 DUF6443 domain-containing protein [Flavobacterium amniphilum]